MEKADINVHFSRVSVRDANEQLLCECAELFAGHYGKWSKSHAVSAMRDKPIRLSTSKLREYLPGDGAWIALARDNETLVGYAFAARFKLKAGTVSWVTQLVVHSDYQNKLIGSRLLSSIWGLSDDFAWGVATANPFAVRALEKVTRRQCHPPTIKRRIMNIKRVLAKIPYTMGKHVLINDGLSAIDTQFDQNLDHLDERLDHTSQKGWLMGKVSRGHEWLAVTFRNQKQARWSDDEFTAFMAASGEIAQKAYERMAPNIIAKGHDWAQEKHAAKEVDFIISRTGLLKDNTILDFGCGNGRHSLAFASKGFNFVGVDFSKTNIEHAQNAAKNNGADPCSFYDDDCTRFYINKEFDIGICLYDVIGSYPDDEANLRILDNLISHVKPQGYLVFSVLSFEYAQKVAIHKVSNGDIPKALEQLSPSCTMQDSGKIFNPDFFVLDTKNKVVYRKECFNEGSDLPEEMIVRDRRYTQTELRKICEGRSLEILAIGHVKAGNFELVNSIDTNEEPTYEILVIARKQLI